MFQSFYKLSGKTRSPLNIPNCGMIECRNALSNYFQPHGVLEKIYFKVVNDSIFTSKIRIFNFLEFFENRKIAYYRKIMNLTKLQVSL